MSHFFVGGISPWVHFSQSFVIYHYSMGMITSLRYTTDDVKVNSNLFIHCDA